MTVEQITSMAANDVEGLIFVCEGKKGKCRTAITVPFTSGTEMIGPARYAERIGFEIKQRG